MQAPVLCLTICSLRRLSGYTVKVELCPARHTESIHVVSSGHISIPPILCYGL
jgi:hypothetical protein